MARSTEDMTFDLEGNKMMFYIGPTVMAESFFLYYNKCSKHPQWMKQVVFP